MRTFGAEKKETFDFMIEGSEKTYSLPLTSAMPVTELNDMMAAQEKGSYVLFRYQVDLMRKYMGDIVDSLTAGTVAEILKAWEEATHETGASTGES